MRENPSLQHEEVVEADETLSLSDLPIYTHNSSDSSNSDSSSKEDITSKNDDFFEFFTGNLPSHKYQEINNIIFCGKLIPNKEANYSTKYEKNRCEYTNICHDHKKSMSNCVLNRIKKFSFARIKWFSVPTTMELADMKNRLRRRSPKTLEMLQRSSTSGGSKLDQRLSFLLRSLSCRGEHSMVVLN